ncbi:MAG: diacylglycerol kinase, partial [Chitinophagaceae bacterium]
MLCGLGFDAQVAHDFANDPDRGLVTYIKKTIAHFFKARAYPFTITAGTDCLTTRALFISIANSNQFGNHFTIAPRASLTDGMLDIVVVGALTKLNLLLQAMRQVGGFNALYTTNIEQAKKSVLYFQTDVLTITNPGGAPIHVDGDPVPVAAVVDVRILKHCFRLIYP